MSGIGAELLGELAARVWGQPLLQDRRRHGDDIGSGREGVLTAEVKDDRMTITYTVEDGADAELTTEATVLLPDGTEQKLTLAQTGAGTYEGETSAVEQGAYALRVTQTDGGEELRSQESGAVKSFAREYDLRGGDRKSLTALTERTGGRLLQSTEEFWDTPVQGARARRSLQGTLLLAALCWLLIDIALRKLPWEDAALALLAKRKASAGRKPTETKKDERAAASDGGADTPRQTKNPRASAKRESEQAKREAAAKTADALLNARKARRGE